VTEVDVGELEERLRTIVGLMYDTRVPLDVLDEKVCPYLAPGVGFVDPWIRARGFQRFRAGLRGFHCAFRFELDVHQLAAQVSPDGRRGRALVEGMMNLRSVPGLVYPLRTILVLEFDVGADGEPRLTDLEEMWSLADMIRHLPGGIGRLYQDVFRVWSGRFFSGFFWLACKLRGQR
jgi:hypothetical protein